VTNACCLLLSSCFDPSPFLSEAEKSPERRYFGKLKRHLCNLARGNSILHGPKSLLIAKGSEFEKYLSLVSQGFSNKQFYLRSTIIQILLIGRVNWRLGRSWFKASPEGKMSASPHFNQQARCGSVCLSSQLLGSRSRRVIV
jgi:hypothetical protein